MAVFLECGGLTPLFRGALRLAQGRRLDAPPLPFDGPSLLRTSYEGQANRAKAKRRRAAALQNGFAARLDGNPVFLPDDLHRKSARGKTVVGAPRLHSSMAGERAVRVFSMSGNPHFTNSERFGNVIADEMKDSIHAYSRLK
jgi:hypothetical protein